MLIANTKPIKIIGYVESSMTKEFYNAISAEQTVDVIHPTTFIQLEDKTCFQYIIAVSFDLSERKQLINIVDSNNLDLITFVHSTSLVGLASVIKSGTFIFPFCNISLESTVGQNCIIGSYSLVGHNSTLGNNCILRPGVMVTGKSTVGNNCVINSRATVTNNTTITDDIEILAFANIVKDIKYAGQYQTKTLKN